MAIIETVLELVDDTVTGIAGGAYADVVSAVEPVILASSVLVVVLVGINAILQVVPVTHSTAISLGVRIVVVNVFMIYGNFTVVYEALTDAPAELGAAFLGGLTGGEITDISDGVSSDLYSGLDLLYRQALDVGQAISQNGGWMAGALTSVLMFLIAALMATVTIIIVSASKIMLAVLIAIGPLAIACTLFKQSAPIFEAWVKLAIGFAFVPLLVAAMAGFTIATAGAVSPADMSSVDTLGDTLSFLVVMMLGTGLMLLVPTFAQGLAATNIGLASIGANAARLPGTTYRRTAASFRAGDDARQGFAAARDGHGVTDRSSGAARIGNYTGSAVTRVASKMKKGQP